MNHNMPNTVSVIEVADYIKSSQVLVAELCPTLCDPMGCSLPGSTLSMGFSRQEYWSGLSGWLHNVG